MESILVCRIGCKWLSEPSVVLGAVTFNTDTDSACLNAMDTGKLDLRRSTCRCAVVSGPSKIFDVILHTVLLQTMDVQ
jgi:hypothetical protein